MAIVQRCSLLPPKSTPQRGSKSPSGSKLELHSFASFDNDVKGELVSGNLPAHWMAPTATALNDSNEDAQVNEFVTPTGEVMTQLNRHHYLHNLATPFPTDNFNVFHSPRERAISSTRRNVEAQEKSFDEENEDRPSCLRKRVLPHSTIGWTRNCVVLDQKQLPDYLFTDLSLIDSKGWLVEDFFYEKLERRKDDTPPDGPRDWKIIYNRKEVADKGDYGYVKVITKNSYWAELLWTLVKGGMVFAMTEYSHFAFMNSCSEKMKPLLVFGWVIGQPKAVIGICWLVFIILRLVAATLSAKLEWHADTESGPDIIRESSSYLSPEEEARILQKTPLSSGTIPKMSFSRKARCMEQWKCFIALVVFQLVGVPGILRDITVFLHPWKGLQPYAAFKADGARAYLLGFPHGSLYRIENRPRAEMRYSLTFLMTLLLSYIKIKIRYPQLDQQDADYNIFNLIIELFPGVLTLGISLVGCLRLLKSKQRCKQWLETQLQSSDVKQQQVAQRLLKKHYGIYYKISSTTGASNVKAQEQETLKQCTDRCAELARELQLWKVNSVLGEQLRTRGVDPVDAERFLCALRDIAKPTLPLNDSLRGPHVASERRSSG